MPPNNLILSSPSPPAFNLPQNQGLFQWAVLCIRWPKYWSFSFSISLSNEYSGLHSFRIDCFDILAVWGNSQKSSPTPQFKSINSSAFSLLYGPTLTSIHDYWKNLSFDYTNSHIVNYVTWPFSLATVPWWVLTSCHLAALLFPSSFTSTIQITNFTCSYLAQFNYDYLLHHFEGNSLLVSKLS